jgi:hypothetical protein
MHAFALPALKALEAMISSMPSSDCGIDDAIGVIRGFALRAWG